MLKRALLTLAFVTGLAACQSNTPYIAITGGGFIFNYRIAEAFAGVTVGIGRALPDGAIVEFSIENPAGGPPIVMRKTPGKETSVEFTTEPLSGIVANKPYQVVVRLLDAKGNELQKIEKPFHSEIDNTALPDAPLTIGPGYAKESGAEPYPV